MLHDAKPRPIQSQEELRLQEDTLGRLSDGEIDLDREKIPVNENLADRIAAAQAAADQRNAIQDTPTTPNKNNEQEI